MRKRFVLIILPWGKYSYLRLPVGMSGSPDIFQEKMSDPMRTLEYVRMYIDDLLILTPGTYNDATPLRALSPPEDAASAPYS